MTSIPALSLVRNGNVEAPPSTREAAARIVRDSCEAALAYALNAGEEPGMTFWVAERGIRERLFEIGRALVQFFLVVAEERVAAALPPSVKIQGRRFRKAPSHPRNLNTMFGVIRYARTYLREVRSCPTKKIRGFHPLDAELGLGADRISMNLVSLATRMATKLSFSDAKNTVSLTVPTAPSTEMIEKMMLGLGHFAERWFEIKPPPTGDGDVLVVMFDGKGVPMASDEELARRRQPRAHDDKAPSPRHRGRHRRDRHPEKPRRKTGDVSKNARVANSILMYTLKRKGALLLGPINRQFYASFGSKENAFRIARREADKRGFAKGCGKLIQIVTDGDNDLKRYSDRYFEEATQTIDFAHCVEKLWQVGLAIHDEGTPEHRAWFAEQRKRLRRGEARQITDGLRRHRAASPKTGPGAKTRHRQFNETITYFSKRIARMNYDELTKQDLEISTGPIEGAIKNVIGRRCDHGGMRWIKERAEAVLQLRCIEMNGDWDAFISYVHDAQRAQAQSMGIRPKLQADSARPIPENRNTESQRRRRRKIAMHRNERLAVAA